MGGLADIVIFSVYSTLFLGDLKSGKFLMISQDRRNDVDACGYVYFDGTGRESCIVLTYTYLREASALLLVLLIRAYQSLKSGTGNWY